jgi:hypothetical protein
LEIVFGNGKSVFYFCGDVGEYSESKQRYELLGGRYSGLVFFNQQDFWKYGLEKVKRIEKQL